MMMFYRSVTMFLLLMSIFLTSVSCDLPGSVGRDTAACADDSAQSTSRVAFPGSTSLVRYSPEKAGLSLELPGEPIPFNLGMPEDAGRGFKEVTAYTYSDGDLFVFLCHYVSHKPEVPREALRDLTAGFMDSRKKSGLTNSSTEASGECKILMRGDYTMNGVPVRFEGFTRRYKANAWLMTVTYSQSDSAARSLAQYAIDSVRIN
jgi:hypothetical protein